MYKTKNIKFPCVIYDGTNGIDVLNMIRKYCEKENDETYLSDVHGVLYYVTYLVDNGESYQVKKCQEQTAYFVVDGKLYCNSGEYFNMFFEVCE